jgi:hypothetical protein
MPASEASTAPALMLFPGWEDIGPWYRAEVQGLTEAQLDFAAPPPHRFCQLTEADIVTGQ